MEPAKLKIGLVPVRRDRFDVKAATEQKYRIEKKVKALTPPQAEIIDCNDLVPDGLVWQPDDIGAVVDKMKAHNIDCLFFPHCNFGTEEVVIRIARSLKVPVLLWGGQDPAPQPGAARISDTQCGLFASSKGLTRSRIVFSYIVNCPMDDDRFSRGYQEFVSVAAVVQAFRKKMRILQIGSRPRPFFSVMCDESDLFTRFGISVVPQPYHEVTGLMEEMVQENTPEFCEMVEEFSKRIDCSRMPEKNLKNTVALREVMLQLARKNNCYAIASECWTLMQPTLGIRPCAAMGELTGMGLPAVCETDILSAVSALLAQAAGFYRTPTFCAEFTIRHPENKNAELLWHCGPFPHKLITPGEQGFLLENARGQWRIKDGDVTICRFDGCDGQYRLFVGEGKSCDGPATDSTYLWLETDDWERWEEKFIFGPYIHHVTGIHGHYGRILAEASRYLPDIQLDSMDDYPLSLGK